MLDVACAKAAGARSVAVATGPCDVATLRKSGADVVVRDLSDTRRSSNARRTDLKYDDVSEMRRRAE